MNPVHEKIAYFKQKQTEILEINQGFEKRKAEILEQYQNAKKVLEEEAEQKLAEAQKPLQEAGEKYRAELKAFAGITDGEKSNVLDLIQAILKVQEMTG
jgi:dsDNA-specific endonuclease/ATPase MutS2